MKHVVIVFLVALGCQSCSRNIECSDPPIYLAFVSFPLTEIDTLVIKRFEADKNYQTLIDSIKVIKDVTAYFVSFNDTSELSMNFPYPYPYFQQGYDYQIFMPSTSRTISISNIIKENTTSKCGAMFGECYCDDKIISIKVDNQIGALHTIRRNMLYLKR